MRSLVPIYRTRHSPLHAARAGVCALFCAALAFAAGLHGHPMVLVTLIAAAIGAGAAAGVRSEVVRSLKLSLPLALLVTLVNPLVYTEGDTVIVRGGELLGRRFDVTLEALAAGALAGLRVAAIVTALGLLSAAVDPDDLLRLFRRISYRSALTASLAARLVPVLARDAARMGDAARCRPHPPGRLTAVRAALSGALERAVEVAAALEVRGYSQGGRLAAVRRPWSRHDLRVLAGALLVFGAALAGRLAGSGQIELYRRLELTVGAGEAALAAALLAGAALPFAGRSSRLGVARA